MKISKRQWQAKTKGKKAMAENKENQAASKREKEQHGMA